MSLKYEIGQKVIIRPVQAQQISPRDADLEPYTGGIGKVTDYYWIRPNSGQVFYIYTVQMEIDNKEIVLHEDEIHLFYGHRDYVEWAIEDRMVSIGWHHQGWDRFKAMIAAVGHVPWSII